MDPLWVHPFCGPHSGPENGRCFLGALVVCDRLLAGGGFRALWCCIQEKLGPCDSSLPVSVLLLFDMNSGSFEVGCDKDWIVDDSLCSVISLTCKFVMLRKCRQDI